MFPPAQFPGVFLHILDLGLPDLAFVEEVVPKLSFVPSAPPAFVRRELLGLVAKVAPDGRVSRKRLIIPTREGLSFVAKLLAQLLCFSRGLVVSPRLHVLGDPVCGLVSLDPQVAGYPAGSHGAAALPTYNTTLSSLSVRLCHFNINTLSTATIILAKAFGLRGSKDSLVGSIEITTPQATGVRFIEEADVTIELLDGRNRRHCLQTINEASRVQII